MINKNDYSFFHTTLIDEIPKTKQIPSKIFDFPEPFSPVMALKCGSKGPIRVWSR